MTTVSKLWSTLIHPGWRGQHHARIMSTAIQTSNFHPTTSSSSIKLDLEDGAAAFQLKTNWELFRALVLLKICSVDAFVDNSLRIMRASEKVLGDRAFAALLRPTFYGQFVGGESESELAATGNKLDSQSLGLMVCPVQEEDVGEADSEGAEFEAKYDRNVEYILDATKNAAAVRAKNDFRWPPCLQLKVTAFMSGDLVVSLWGVTGELCSTVV